jgi:tRNA(Ile)-lysidine synthase
MGPAPGPLPAGLSRDELLAAVDDALQPVPLRSAVVVALSGGPDSSALAYLVAEARPDLDATLAHVRHGLRDDAADLAVVATHRDWLGLPLEIRAVEVDPAGRGLEAAARDARYAALAEIADAVGATHVLTGHTADDQAETVLLRLARGSGTDGLGAMRPGRPLGGHQLIRPLLRIRRATLLGHLAAEGLPAAEDPGNRDPAVRRNVVRHEVLPALARAGTDPVGALGRLAELAAADAAALDGLARDAAASMVVRTGPVRSLPDAALAGLPLALRRRVVRHVLDGLTDRPLSAAAVDRVLHLGAGAAVDLASGVRATAGGGWRTLGPAEFARCPSLPLPHGGAVTWEPADLRLRTVTPQGPQPPAAAGQTQITFDLAEAWTPPAVRVPAGLLPPGGHPERMTLALPADVGPLEVRHRAPGDRVRTGGGTRRLQDVLVDAALPRPVRELWPVVAGADGRIVWVPGVAADAEVARTGRAAPHALLVVETAV